MSKVLLRFSTSLGPRTVVAEIGDAVTAQAVVNRVLWLGEEGSVVEEMPRISMKEHMAKTKRANARGRVKVISATPSNVTPLRKGRDRGA